MGISGAYANAPGSTLTAAQAEPGASGARIESTVGTLELRAVRGSTIEVNGELVAFVDSVGASTKSFDPLVDHTILPDGSDSGIPPAVSNLYGVYFSNGAASFGAKSLRLCSQFQPVYYNGAAYLDSLGNARNWRYLGAAVLDASGFFQDTGTAREVCNLYNRVAKPIQLQPGYLNDNLQTNFALNSAVWARLGGGVNDSATYLDLAGIPGAAALSGPEFHLFVSVSAVGGNTRAGIGLDSATTPSVAVVFPAGGVASCSLFPNVAALVTTTRHTVYMLGVSGGSAATFIGDYPRQGAATDPPCTRLVGQVWT